MDWENRSKRNAGDFHSYITILFGNKQTTILRKRRRKTRNMGENTPNL